MARPLVLVVPDDDAPPATPTLVYSRGGVLHFDDQREALEFVVRRQVADPHLAVEVRVR